MTGGQMALASSGPKRFGGGPVAAKAACCVIAIALALAPAAGMGDFGLSFLLEMMVFSVLALSLNLLVGNTGLVSLGHAAFFAIGAYAAALCANNWSTDVLVTLSCAVLAGAIFAVPIGFLSIRLPGFYFLMITFAFSQMVYQVAFRWAGLTGGSDGLRVAPPTLIGSPVLIERVHLYWFALVVFVASIVLLYRLGRSSFGRVLAGIRENTRRMRALGYDVRAYKLAAFVLSASIAAFVGAVYVQFSLFVSPDNAHWIQSATVLVMVLVGGRGSLIGPLIGATSILFLQHQMSSHTEYWNAVLGLIFVVVIWLSPQGIVGLVTAAKERMLNRTRSDA